MTLPIPPQPWPQQAAGVPATPHPQGAPPTKRTRRIFLWAFLAVQAIFLIWVVSGDATASGTPADCLGSSSGLDAQTCNAASDHSAASSR